MAYTYNLTDFNDIIRNFLKTNTTEKYPNIDVSDNSVFDDLYTKPNISNMSDFIEVVNQTDIMMSLSNPDDLSEDTLDIIGYYNYGLERKSGERARAVLNLSFTVVPSGQSIIVPANSVFSTPDGLTFISPSTAYTYTNDELVASYNPSTLLYTVQLAVSASDVGEDYNVGANQITIFPNTISDALESVTNPESAAGGTAKETNADYAKRIREWYVTRYLGTSPNYEAGVKEITPDITDVKVFGYGDPEMTRDVIISDDEEIHIGGKVDIYVKGSEVSQHDVLVAAHTNFIRLNPDNCKYAELLGNVQGLNITTQSAVTFASGPSADADGSIIFTVDSSSYTADTLDTLRFTYTRAESGALPQETFTEFFEVGTNNVSCVSPMIELASVELNESELEIDSGYSVLRTDLAGNTIDSSSAYYLSSQEKDFIVLEDSMTYEEDSVTKYVVNGEMLKLSYSADNTIARAAYYFNEENNKIITTDILIKEGTPKYINIKIEVAMSDGEVLTDVRKSQIQSVVNNYILKLGMSDSIKESDIVGAIYADSDIMSYLSYVYLPFTAFYVPSSLSDDIIDQRDGTEITTGPDGTTVSTVYIALNKIAIETV